MSVENNAYARFTTLGFKVDIEDNCIIWSKVSLLEVINIIIVFYKKDPSYLITDDVFPYGLLIEMPLQLAIITQLKELGHLK